MKLEEERGNPAYASAMDSRKGKERGGESLKGKDGLASETGGRANVWERIASNEMRCVRF